MGIIHKVAAVGIAGLVAFSTLAFAPVPNTTTYQDTYLFSEDGSQANALVAGTKYKVAFIPTVEITHLYDAKPPYRAAIAVLDSKGNIRYFREMSEAKAVNSFGRYLEIKHSYKSLGSLKLKLDRIVKNAVNHY